MIRRSVIAILITAATPIFDNGAASASEGELVLFANGEDLAVDGFIAPKLTRDNWELRFDHIYVTLAKLFAHQADPPYDAETGGALVVYTCGEFVGSERKGVVKSGSSEDLELTFHLDHIFGRADRDAGGAVNAGAVRFGILTPGLTLAGWACTIGLAAISLRRIESLPDYRAGIPRPALMSAVFLAGSQGRRNDPRRTGRGDISRWHQAGDGTRTNSLIH